MPEPKTTPIADADLELLLAEADRDDPILSPPRDEPFGRALEVKDPAGHTVHMYKPPQRG